MIVTVDPDGVGVVGPDGDVCIVCVGPEAPHNKAGVVVDIEVGVGAEWDVGIVGIVILDAAKSCVSVRLLCLTCADLGK